MSFTDALKQLYRSQPEGDFKYITLEIFHDVMAVPKRIYLAGTNTPKNFRLESTAPRNPGASVQFEAASFDISEPSIDDKINSQVGITLGIGAFTELNELSDALEATPDEFLIPVEIIYRIYQKDETDIAPSFDPPTKMFLEGMEMNSLEGVQLTANTTNNATFRTGELYKIEDFPGLITNA